MGLWDITKSDNNVQATQYLIYKIINLIAMHRYPMMVKKCVMTMPSACSTQRRTSKYINTFFGCIKCNSSFLGPVASVVPGILVMVVVATVLTTARIGVRMAEHA